jgi:hypothetical protein
LGINPKRGEARVDCGNNFGKARSIWGRCGFGWVGGVRFRGISGEFGELEDGDVGGVGYREMVETERRFRAEGWRLREGGEGKVWF